MPKESMFNKTPENGHRGCLQTTNYVLKWNQRPLDSSRRVLRGVVLREPQESNSGE